MTPVADVLKAYRTASRFLPAFTAILLAVRLVASAALVPLVGLLLGAAIAMSDQSALTDQDIAWFLLTPTGFLGALAAVSLTIAASVLDVTMMTVALARGQRRPLPALKQGFGHVLPRLPQLLWFSAGLVLRVLAIVLPFLLAMAAVAWALLRDYDINYYLTFWPPMFLLAAGLILCIGLVLAGVLLARLSGWAIALHLMLVQGAAPPEAFRESASLLQGRRRGLLLRLGVWVGVRFLIGAAVALIFGALTGWMSDIFGANLRLVAGVTLAMLLLWGLMNAVVTALAHGALAGILLREFTVATGYDSDAAALSHAADGPRMPLWAIIAGAAAFVLAGLLLGDRLLDHVGPDRSVAIIAHRGAAGLRPENTMAAVRKAIEDGADWVEIDVQENADGTVIVAHDSDFMKLAGNPLKVWNATSGDLASIDIGSWYGPDYAGERTPLLRDVLLAAEGRAKVLIELKYYGHDVDLERRVAAVVDEVGMAEDIAVMSLKVAGLQKMRTVKPVWRSGVLAAKSIGNLAGMEADFLAVNTGQVSLRLIAAAHEAGKDVYVWTVDDPVTMSRMISMGVDGLITNQPALAREVMERRNALSTAERMLLWLADRFDLGDVRLIADEKDA